jgi:hypothetical protein
MNGAYYKMCYSGFGLILLGLVLIVNSCDVAEDLLGGNPTVAKLEGDWTCDETSEIFKSTSSVYAVTISGDPDNDNGIIIDNFYGINAAVYATVSGMSLNIDSQTAEGGYIISGSGIIASNYQEINWTYIVDDGSGVVDHVTAVYTKN